MANATITTTQKAAYEKPLTANTVYTVDIAGKGDPFAAVVHIINHGPGLVFVGGSSVTVDDPNAEIVPPSAYIRYTVPGDAGFTATVGLISAAAGSISVVRR